MKQLLRVSFSASMLASVMVTAVADPAPALMPAGAFTVQNNTGNNMEFSGLIGGYASVNPLVAGGTTTAMILPDPGSNIVRGHVMVYSSTPGQYVDNIVFVDQMVTGSWQLQAYDLYGALKVIVNNNTGIIIQN